MKRWLPWVSILLGLAVAGSALGFCGFYVAKADAKLYNKASQVVLVRDEGRTVLTMSNDFRGDPKEFAIVIPVPTRIEKEQIHIGDKAVIDHLDAYSAPRLVRPSLRFMPSGGQEAFVTRLHLRYDAAHFPEDLAFQETADRENFQGRYVLRHPWTGSESCPDAREYRKQLRERREREAQTLASLTGWDINGIRDKMGTGQAVTPGDEDNPKWWKRLWGNGGRGGEKQ
jgi:hypothetical protein